MVKHVANWIMIENIINYIINMIKRKLTPEMFILDNWATDQQAGVELGQAQLKVGLDFTLIFCRLDLSPFGFIELVL